MTGAAVVVKIVLGVIGIERSAKVSRVTRITERRSVGVAACMAVQARQRCVGAGQQESGDGVVESARFGRCPRFGRMALLALVREAVGDVIGIGYARKTLGMTGIAVGGGVRVAAGMAAGALESGVSAGQQEPSVRMIKIHRRPAAGRMALRAIMAEVICRVIGIADTGKIVAVAGVAVTGSVGIAGSVAADTIERSMRTR